MKIKNRKKGNDKVIAKAIIAGIIILSFYQAIFKNNYLLLGSLIGTIIGGNILAIINKRRKIKSIQKYEDYKKLEQYYNNIIDNFICLSNELNIKEPIQIFCLYLSMYKKGLLSHNKKFIYSNNTYELFNLIGINVIYGNGVCRNITSMLNDIYRKMGYSSDTLKIYVKSNNNYSKLINGSLKIFGNHMVALVDDGKYKYILCPTNRRIFIINKGKLINIFDKKYTAKICLAACLPAYLYEEKNNNIEVIKRLCMPSLTKEEMLEKYNAGIITSEFYEQKLEAFYDNNKKIYEKINKININF